MSAVLPFVLQCDRCGHWFRANFLATLCGDCQRPTEENQ